LKDNQPTLCGKVEATAATAELIDTQTSENKGHNRGETRTVAVFGAAPAVAGTEWQDLVSAIVMVTRTTYKRDSKTGLWSTATAISYYLSSKPVSASLAADAIRAHWGIENRNHYPRDVAFREDASRIRHNPGIFARLRSFAANILRVNKTGSFVQDRYRASLSGLEGLLALKVC
jgi:predicted transposase YbfD/YdcC